MPVPGGGDDLPTDDDTGSGVAYPGTIGVLTFTLDPYGIDTVVTLVINGPDGATITPTPVSTDGGHTWTAMPLWTAVGRWVPVWTITGTGSGVFPQRPVYVTAIPSASALVSWRPELWQVAAYIPRRTLVGAVNGYGQALETFTADTHPSAGQVNNIITDACAWVGALVNPVDDSLTDLARSAAAIRSAALVELTYPDNRDDLSTAETLLKQAESMRVDLDRANTAVTGTDPETPATHLLPVYSFPAPAWYGDLAL